MLLTTNANDHAERWIGSVRRECLDRLLILSAGHLRRVLAAYVAHDTRARPHQSLEQRCPVPASSPMSGGAIRRRDVLGGLLHE